MATIQMIITATSSLLLSIILIISLTPLNIDAKELADNCEIKISPNVSKILSRLVKSGKCVFDFEVHLSDKNLDGLLNPVPLDYFANARRFTWIPDKPDGLIAYKNFYYDFPIYSLNLLGDYIATPRIDFKINCGKQNIQRYDLIRLIFEELKRILFIDKLKMGESGYMCFLINLSQEMKKKSPHILQAYRRLGINREIVKNYCCEIYKDGSYVYQPKSICSGNIIDSAECPTSAGYIYRPELRLCFQIGSKIISWNEAADNCNKDRGQLIHIKNEEIMNYLQSVLPSYFWSTEYFYFGLSRDIRKNVLFWQNGEALTYYHWASSDRNNHKGIQHCGALAPGKELQTGGY